MSTVIIFGATGAVGSAAAQEAADRGCQVWLAMRDTKKEIKGIDESSGSFHRVQADLGDPESVKKAIEASKATSAFIYAIFAPGSMKPTVQALKDSGVNWVVLLSSFTVRGDKRQIQPEDAIPHHHAEVEIDLEDVGIPYAALRPGSFASNELWKKQQILSGKVHIVSPKALLDTINPINIGQVGGAILSEKRNSITADNPLIVYLYGPELITQNARIEAISKAIGKEIEVVEQTDEQYLESAKSMFPEVVAKYLAKMWHQCEDREFFFSEEHYREGVDNIMKYSGKPPISFNQWVEANKGAFVN